MAKVKESIYKNWEEINQAMKTLGQLNIKKNKLEGEQTIKINEVKEATALKAGELINNIKEIEKEIARFTQQNKNEFIKKRHKKLAFGTVSFKITKSVSCECVADAIKALKSLNLDFCIRCNEELNKDEIKEISDEMMLSRAGITIKKTDKLTIEPNYIKISE